MKNNITSLDALHQKIQEFNQSNDVVYKASARILNHIVNTYDIHKYIEIEESFLKNEIHKKGAGADQRKFFDLPFWIHNKTMFAAMAGLHGSSKKHILDLGSGAGHFLLVNQALGHQAYGLDVPNDMYDKLGNFFKLNRTHHIINAYEPLPKSATKFDFITAFYVNFNTDFYSSKDDTPGENAWGEAEWNYFFTDVSHNLLTKDGCVFMMINPSNNAKSGLRHSDNSLIPYFRKIGATIVNENLRIIKLTDFSRFQ